MPPEHTKLETQHVACTCYQLSYLHSVCQIARGPLTCKTAAAVCPDVLTFHGLADMHTNLLLAHTPSLQRLGNYTS